MMDNDDSVAVIETAPAVDTFLGIFPQQLAICRIDRNR
jgi:hypothetical protein